MGWWGAALGGAAGLALGGPLGALAGALAGVTLEQLTRSDAPPPPEQAKRSAGFTIAVVALGAKMAKADGSVTHDEVAAFRQFFSLDPEDEPQVRRFFDLARHSAEGYEAYARQAARLFEPRSSVLEELLAGLFLIARADGVIHVAELRYLRRVAEIFGFDDADFERLKATWLGTEARARNPYAALGVAPDADLAVIKAAWKKLALEHHPDRLTAQGLPQEAIALAQANMAAINAAWDEIRKQRGAS